MFELAKICTFDIKGPRLPKRLYALVLLFWKGSLLESTVLIGCLFSIDNFQVSEIRLSAINVFRMIIDPS